MHSRRVTLYRRIQEAFDFGKGDDFVEFPDYLGPGHAEYCPVQEHILPACQFRMKAGSNFQQARDPPRDGNPSRRRIGNAAQDLEQGRLACAVTSDYSDSLARFDIEGDVFQCPELLTRTCIRPFMPSCDTREVFKSIGYHIPQCDIARTTLMPQHITFSKAFHLNDRRHDLGLYHVGKRALGLTEIPDAADEE